MKISATPGVATEYLRELLHSCVGKNILVTMQRLELTDIQLGWIDYEEIEEIFVEDGQCIKVKYTENREVKEDYFDAVLFVGDVFEWHNSRGKRIDIKF
jgi:hypothetical protein